MCFDVALLSPQFNKRHRTKSIAYFWAALTAATAATAATGAATQAATATATKTSITLGKHTFLGAHTTDFGGFQHSGK